jgi:CheY-like chemotaxis protein
MGHAFASLCSMWPITTPSKKPLILIVDDEIQIVSLLRSDLNEEGFDVVSATDTLTAKQMAWDLHPDLLVVDIFMPGIDGLAMMEAIHERPEMKHTPVIFISGHATESFKPDIKQSTLRYALIKKPLYLPEFNQLVRQFLS